jgi:integrase
MARGGLPSRRRQRGFVEQLPSGSFRVCVYTGVDPLTGRDHYLKETVGTRRDAERVRVRLLSQVDEDRSPRTRATVNQLLDRYLDVIELEPTTRQGYVGKIDKHIRPTIGALQVGRLDAETLERLYAQLRKCREHCHGRRYVQHRTAQPHTCDPRCAPHVCTPLSAASVRVVHSILSGALTRAVKWHWIAVNPALAATKPAAPTPDPQPPTVAEAARILTAAWEDLDWGMLVWLAMVIGARRGELCGLRWRHVDLTAGVLTVRQSQGQLAGRQWEKDTKTHQTRRVALDPETIQLLTEHHGRCATRAKALDVDLDEDAFVFSGAPDGSTPLRPDSITQRYGRLAKRLGIKTHLHALRHYSATELIAAGVDPRTVAGRLGHSGGGSTTLRVYSAWVSEADQRAAVTLARRLPRPAAPTQP